MLISKGVRKFAIRGFLRFGGVGFARKRPAGAGGDGEGCRRIWTNEMVERREAGREKAVWMPGQAGHDKGLRWGRRRRVRFIGVFCTTILTGWWPLGMI